MDKKIRAYIYGAGCEYRKIMKHINHFYDKLEIRGIILTEPVENRIDGLKVFTLSEVKNEGFDLIIISVIKWQSIYEILKNNGIADNKIILGAHFYDYEFDLKKYLEESNAIENIKYYENYCAREKEHCKEAVLNYPPRWITIAVSSVCPNKCLFCAYHGEDARGNSEIYNIPFTMKMDEFVKIVDMAKTACVERIHVCGTGEPFANPHILDMLDYVILRYGDVTFQTEFWPQLFEQKNYLSEIVKRGENISSITTDICSGDPVVHEKIKYGEKFEYLMDCLETLSKEGHIYLKPFMILTRSNWKNMKNIIDEFIKRDIYNFELNIGNLFSYDYSEFTSSKNVYTSLDNDITEELYNVK